ncbi:MAG: hypothetical protein ACREJ3_11745 [Polyangiaceae bacterium]
MMFRRKSGPTATNTSTALAQAQPSNPWDDVRLQKLWLASQRRDWRSLAVLGAGRSVNTLPIAEVLAQLAWSYRGQPSAVCDLRDLSMRLVDYQIREVSAQVEAGARVMVSLRSIFENPTAIPVARQTDAVILCIELAKTGMKEAEQTIAEVGHERVIGSIVIRPRAPSTVR